MDDPPPETPVLLLQQMLLLNISYDLLYVPAVLVALLCASGLISGAEVAFFSLTKSNIEDLESAEKGHYRLAAQLIQRPKRLLATILIANNFVNVGIVILSTYLVSTHVPQDILKLSLFGFLPVTRIIEVFGITAAVLLFGEVMPKIYAGQYAVSVATFAAYPLHYLSLGFSFLSVPLIKLTNIIDKGANTANDRLSVDELSHALDLTKPVTKRELEDRKILEGIVEFGNTDVKQIMCPRSDVAAVDHTMLFPAMMEEILESGYSRIPVYKESLDNIVGILHVKDLLPHMYEGDDFDWKSLVRSPFFVPESKMIDDLLEEFRQRKVHMAVVIDEFGGCEGVVTLEDIMEEIVGEISDEFDEEEAVYSKLDEQNYVFEGKTNLKQFYRILQIDGDTFEDHKGEADTLAGFILELSGRMPHKNQRIPFDGYEFTVESVDKRRIKRIKVTLTQPENLDVTRDNTTGLLGLGLLLVGSFMFSSCGEEYTPKPKGYIRIDLPEKEYSLSESDCPFLFDVPAYAKYVPDLRAGSAPCWFDIDIPQFKAKVHFSYLKVDNNLGEYLENSRTMTNKHISKASGINEQLVVRPEANVYGMYWRIEGSGVASPIQLYLTDSTTHFLRGALYFNVVPNNDSLAPVIDFIEADLQRMIASFSWRNSVRT